METKSKTITLYDAGGVFILIFLFGIPFGSVFDYLWNLLVFSVGLRYLSRKAEIDIGKGRRLAYCFFITILGLIIDWAYFELTWDMHLAKSANWIPAMSQPLQLAWLLMPIVMIGLVNAALSYAYLKLDRKQAIILGAVMGIFTAPWILPTVPYIFGWVM